MVEANGQVDTASIESTLEAEVTCGYYPQLPLESLWLTGSDMPQITLRRDLEFMQMHPIVCAALEYYRAGITSAEFWGGQDYNNPDNLQGKPVSPDARVSAFVLAHVDKFWRQAVPLLQEGGYPYGWAAGEHVYEEKNGLMTWSYLKDFHPNDCYFLTHEYQPVGVRVKNIRGREPVDLWFAQGAIPAKACWYPHRPRFGHFYGRSQLMAAWRPWRRLGWRDAVEQVIDAAVYRAGYRGPIVKHPPGDSAPTGQQGIPATRLDGGGLPRRNNRDVARQIVEWAKAGAGFTIPSDMYPPTQGGGPKWGVDFPEHVMDVRPLIDVARYLEDQICLGVGVPPELIRAGGTGSGYSGRSIPREAFLDQQQHIANLILRIFIDEVVRPLVLRNFGDIPFAVECKSLLQSAATNRQAQLEAEPGKGDPTQQVGAPGESKAPTGANAPQSAGGVPQPPQVGSAMSIVAARRNRVMEIVRRALRRAA